ncbi:hypothetical protein LPJ59_002189 [Coemansia sp. RSA 2399]|nr:hypothetical protein LPJ59_002189 [Coemansia sp. RSA 2399]KAJ1889488.1 hypothetical protein LPJ81_006119 [Coemansia sp. IMI 209127]
MPLCQIITNIRPMNSKALSIKVSSTVAELLSKPLSYVMAMVTYNSSLTFGGTDEPAAYVQIGSIGSVGGNSNINIVTGITNLVAAELDVEASRIYVAIQDIDGAEFALNGSTFA